MSHRLLVSVIEESLDSGDNAETLARKVRQNFKLYKKESPISETYESWVEDNFMLRVLGVEKWVITERTTIRDFWPKTDIEYAQGIGADGAYSFTRELGHRTETDIVVPTRFREQVIHRSLEIFGINPNEYVDKPLIAVFQLIEARISAALRVECLSWLERDLAV